MLPNIEYANFNRLLVTLGFLSIALALAIPWVLLGDTQILLVPESEITDLSTVGEQTIRERQAIYNRLPDFWAAPATLGAVGCILIFSGAIRMYSRQAADDEKADLERDQLALSIGQQSDSERNAAAESEAGAALGDLDPRAELPKASTVAQLAQRIRGLVDSVAGSTPAVPPMVMNVPTLAMWLYGPMGVGVLAGGCFNFGGHGCSLCFDCILPCCF